tara:strand:+ start:54 stop:608 length:555 start_codon:yes stop_codon:yes gene_type:complete
MRVKYTFTTDIKGVPSGVHFHLSRFLGKHSVDSNLQYLMNLLSKEELNFSLITKKIVDLREQLSKFDILLGEASTILAACQQFELDAKMPIQEFVNEQTPTTVPPPQKVDPAVSPPRYVPESNPPPPQESSSSANEPDKKQLYTNQIQRNLAQMTDIAQTLGKLKRSSPWETYENSLSDEEANE